MPNYSLQINSHFKPFSFERYIQPLQIYGQAYKEQEEALNNLQMQANTVEAMINRARDTKAAERYDAYMQGLNAQAEALSTSGLLPGVRNSVNTLRGDYFNRIVPIQKAYETMMKQIEEQRKTGDTKINEYNAGDLSIDDFLENPEKTYRTIDRQNLYVKSAAAFGALQNDLTDYSLQTDKKIKDNYQKAFIKKYGARPEDVSQFMSEVQAAIRNGASMDQIVARNSTMANIFNNLFRGSGVSSWGNRNAEIDVANTILSGATNAIGKSDINLVTDQEKVLNKQLANARAIAREKGSKGSGIPSRLGLLRGIKGVKPVSAGHDDILRYNYLFNEGADGNWSIRNVPLTKTTQATDIKTGLPYETTGASPEFTFLKKHGLLEKVNGEYQITKDQNKINKFANDHIGALDRDYDLLGYKEVYREVDPSDFGNVMSYLSMLADPNTNKVKTMSYVNNNGVPTMSEPGRHTIDLGEKQKSGNGIKGARFVDSNAGTDGEVYLEVEFTGDNGHYAVPIPEEIRDGVLRKFAETQYINNLIEENNLLDSNDPTKINAEDVLKLKIYGIENENNAFEDLFKSIGTSTVKPAEIKQEDVAVDAAIEYLLNQ